MSSVWGDCPAAQLLDLCCPLTWPGSHLCRFNPHRLWGAATADIVFLMSSPCLFFVKPIRFPLSMTTVLKDFWRNCLVASLPLQIELLNLLDPPRSRPPHIVPIFWIPHPCHLSLIHFPARPVWQKSILSGLSRPFSLLSWFGFCLFFWAWYFYNHSDSHAFSSQPSSSPSYGIPWRHLPLSFVSYGQENRTCIDLLQPFIL